MDFAQARRMMVDGQVRTADVTDLAIQAAMLELPRERFLPADRAALAYLDLDVPVGGNGGQRRLIKPMVLAKLLQAAEVAATDRALDVGCATGYSAAVLARLAAKVVALEQDAALAAAAKSALAEVGADNVTIVTGPIAAGAAEFGPYDVILIDGATEIAPQTLFDQLSDGGRLVCVQGRAPVGKAMLYRSVGGNVSGRVIFDAVAPLLPGFAATPAFVF